mgnify:CR=1 FL=1
MKGDEDLARAAGEAEREIDQKERDIESLCMKLLLQQQPVARDLRTISAALKMISDMERIGDQASDIAEITRDIEDSPVVSHVPSLRWPAAPLAWSPTASTPLCGKPGPGPGGYSQGR